MIPQPIDAVPLFSRLSEEERELVTARLRRRQTSPGELIFAAGKPSDALYVITSGWVKLEDAATLSRAITLANLGAGSLLGEVDTLLGRPYTTSARSATSTLLLSLSRSDLESLIDQNPDIGLKFSSALGMRVAFLEQYLVRHRLREIELLSGLSEDDLRTVAAALDFRSFTQGDAIVEDGAPGEAAFIVEQGTVRIVTKSNEGDSFEDMGEGSLIGHTALITGKPYPATARAVTEVQTWFLPRSAYQILIQEHPAVKLAFSRALAEHLSSDDQADAVERMRGLALFSDVPAEALSALAGRLVLRHFPTGELIYAEGDPGDALYIIESGDVKLLDSVFSDARLLERIHPGSPFGEMALLTGRTRAECARAASDATIWVLYKTDYDSLMAQYPEISVSLSRALTERLRSHEDDFVERNLRRIGLFSNLPSSDLRAISKKVRGCKFRSGEIICFAGQPAQTLYLIERGEIKLIGVGPNGQPLTFALMGAGESFGEQSIVQNTAYNSTAQAIGEVQLWSVSKDDFLGMLEQFPTLAITVTRLMADRLARSQAGPTAQQSSVRTAPTMARTAPAVPNRAAGSPSSAVSRHARSDAGVAGPRIRQPLSGARPVKTGRALPAPPSQGAPQAGRSSRQAGVAAASQTGVTASSAPRFAPMRTAPAPTQGAAPVQPFGASPAASTIGGTGGEAITASALPANRSRAAARVSVRPMQPTGLSFVEELGNWFGGLSVGAKLRMAAVGVFSIWFVFVAIPATAITAMTATVGGLQSVAPAAASPQPTGAKESPTAVSTAKSVSNASGPASKPAKVAFAVATNTPLPSKTPIPTVTSTPRPRPTRTPRPTQVAPVAAAITQPTQQALAAPQPSPTAAIPALPPIYWDPRLGSGPEALPHLDSVHIEAASVAHGQKFWRAISVKFEDVNEAGNDHTIYVKVLGEDGKRITGEKAHLTSVGGLSEYPEEKPAGDLCDCNFNYPMYGDGYGFNIEDQYPSDKVAGMIMPMRRHVNYRVTFQLVTNP